MPTYAQFDPAIGLGELVRLYNRRPAETPGASVRIAVLSNFSTQFLVMGLSLALEARGVNAIIYEASYSQWEQELRDPNAGIISFQPDIILLSLTSSLLYLRESLSAPRSFAENMECLLRNASARLPGRFVITLPEPLEEEIEQTGWAYAWRQQLVDELRTRIERLAVLVDIAPLVMQIGTAQWHSARFLTTKKLPYNPQVAARHADYLSQTIAAVALKQRVRLVVVDLDNTLWGGIVGELGWRNVNLDPEGEGFAYLRLQRFLLGLHERGVLLSICSKNNLEDALEVFRRRPEMLLKVEHFADIRINWEPKSSNIAATLTALNLTQTGTVFIDDSPFERGEVCAALPEVWAPDFPEDVVELVPALLGTGLFSFPQTTHEDAHRNSLYLQERQRQNAASTVENIHDYYRSLSLTLAPRPLREENLERTIDLLAKTNQFNLTTRRYSRSEIHSLTIEHDCEIWTYGLSDRFGEYGIIAVVILRRLGNGILIDTWAMSCRAMGRTVERGIFQHIYARARHQGAEQIVGDYIPTHKNKPVERLYLQLGFVESNRLADVIRYVYPDMGTSPVNEFVSIQNE
jgi:FkbH-like protein